MSEQDFIEQKAFEKLLKCGTGGKILQKNYRSYPNIDGGKMYIEYQAYWDESTSVSFGWSKCCDNPMDAVNEVIGEAKPNELSRS